MSRFMRVQIYNSAGTAVAYDNLTDTTWGIDAGTLDIEKQIMDKELKYGNVFASKASMCIFGIDENLSGRRVDITGEFDVQTSNYIITADGDRFVDADGNYIVSAPTHTDTTKLLFTGIMNDSVKDGIGTDRVIDAYDVFYSIRDTNVADFWNTYINNNSTVNIANMMLALLTSVGLSYVNTTLPTITISDLKQEYPEELTVLTFGDLLKMCCELLLVCPTITAHNTVSFVKLSNTVYHDVGDNIEKLESKWEDYTTATITGIGFYNGSSDLLHVQGTEANVYKIVGNLFTNAMTTSELTALGTSMLTELSTISYTPAHLKLIISKLEYNLGDGIVVGTDLCYLTHTRLYGSTLIEQEIDCEADGETLSDEVDNPYGDLIETHRYSRIRRDIDSIEIAVGEGIDHELPVVDMTAYYDGTTHTLSYTEIQANDLPYTIFGDASTKNIKFGVLLDTDITNDQLIKPKKLKYTTTNDGNVETYTGYIYNSQNQIVTNDIALGAVLYVEYRHNQTVGSSTVDGFWVIPESYSYSAINVANGQTVLKANSSGRIVQVALGADASTGSSFSVKADDIEFIANNKIQLTTNNLEIYSTNFQVDSSGKITATSGDIGGWNIGSDSLWYKDPDPQHEGQYLDRFILLNSVNKSVVVRYDNYKSVMTSGGYELYYTEQLTGKLLGTYWGGTSSASNKRGTTFSCESGGSYLDLGVENNGYISRIMLNNGLNPNGITDPIIMWNKTRFVAGMQVDGGITFLSDNDYIQKGTWNYVGTTYHGLYANRNLFTDGRLIVGNNVLIEGIGISRMADALIDASSNNHVSGNNLYTGFAVYDNNMATRFCEFYGSALTTGETQGYVYVRNKKTDGTEVTNVLGCGVQKDGTLTYRIGSASAFRNALGLGSLATKSSVANADITAVDVTKVSNLGAIVNGTNADETILPSVWTTVNKITLTAGTWLVLTTVAFASNSNGFRSLGIGTDSSATGGWGYAHQADAAAANGRQTTLHNVSVFSPTASTTYYVSVYQNSGSNISTHPRMLAIRIK